jgi:methylmalonyl-CoA/ethylmalonyl-CoA epimerase
MIAEGLHFHHLGMAVSKPETARRSLQFMGYQLGEAVFDPGQKAYVQMCTSPALPNIELVYSESPESPVVNLTRLHDEIIYHMCFETESIEAAVRRWRVAGVRVFRIAPGMPAPLFGERTVAFYQVQGLGLIELLETA